MTNKGTTPTRKEQAAEARANYNEARDTWETTSIKARRNEAAEQMEFWGSKVAMLETVGGWA